MVRTLEYLQPRGGGREDLLTFLVRTFTYCTADEWRGHLAAGYVSVNSAVVRDGAHLLAPRDTIAFDPPRELEPEVDASYRVLHNDDHIVVVSKSGNIPVGEGGRYCRNTLSAIVSESLAAGPATVPPTLFVVHRLDKETSGLVVLAKTTEAAANLGAQFAVHSSAAPASQQPLESAAGAGVRAALKRYQVVLVGRLTASRAAAVASPPDVVADIETGSIDVQWRIGHAFECERRDATAPKPKPTREDPLVNIRMKAYSSSCANHDANNDGGGVVVRKAGPFGKPSRTVVTPVAWVGGDGGGAEDSGVFTMCDVELYSGRTHQIRVHCATLGYPVLGDKLYLAGGGTAPADEYVARSKAGAALEYVMVGGASVAARRQLLHCSRLGFFHPASGKWVEFDEDASEVFRCACPWLRSLDFTRATDAVA